MHVVVLPPELYYLETLAEALMKRPLASPAMDHAVHVAVATSIADKTPAYTANLDMALSLIPHGWWWHISHLEVSIIPNRAEPDIPISNAIDYRMNGHAIGYTTMLYGERSALPISVCSAVIRAFLGLKAKAAAIRDKRMYMIQTGSGPMLVDIDGCLKEVPMGAWLDEDGKLIARKEVFPTYTFVEPEPDDDEL